MPTIMGYFQSIMGYFGGIVDCYFGLLGAPGSHYWGLLGPIGVYLALTGSPPTQPSRGPLGV